MKPAVKDRHKEGGAAPKQGRMEESSVYQIGKKAVLTDHLYKRSQQLEADVVQFMKFFENSHKKENRDYKD
jgi:hypothetical protein